MKTITIGDIHGRDDWKKINPDDYDKIIFIGDYVDSFDISVIVILHNLKEIIEFKKKYPDKVVLLLGNHDVAYIFNHSGVSGFESAKLWDYQTTFMSDIDLFQVAYEYGNHLWTHAGVSLGWFNRYLKPLMDEDETIGHALNDMWVQSLKEEWKPLFQNSFYRGGSNSLGGPLWADKQETVNKIPKGIHQIVGHTALMKINTIFPKQNDFFTSITFTDVLGAVSTRYKKVDPNDPKFYELIIE
jgi:hypothetical protein